MSKRKPSRDYSPAQLEEIKRRERLMRDPKTWDGFPEWLKARQEEEARNKLPVPVLFPVGD